MIIRKKIFLILFIVSLCSYLSFCIFSPKLIYLTFEKIQEKTSRRNLERVYTSFNNRIKILSTVARDWGAWNDSCTYLKNKNKEFEDSNLTYSTLSNFNADLMVYMDLDLNIISHRFISYSSTNDFFETPDDNFITEIKQYIKQLNLKQPGELKGGFAYLSDKAMMVSICAITDSNLKEGPFGYLIIGSWVREQTILNIEKDFQLGVNLIPFKNLSKQDEHKYCKCDKKHVCYSKIIQDLTGTPHFILKTREKSLLLSEGFKQVVKINVINLLFVIILALLLWEILTRKFIKPLQILTSYFSSPDRENLNDDTDLTIHSNDEFEFLTSTFNRISGKFKNNQLKLLFALESINDGIWELDIETNTVELSSRSLNILDIDDTQKNTMKWKEFSALFAEKDQQRVIDLPQKFHETDEPRNMIEVRLKQKQDEAQKHLLITAKLFTSPFKKIIGTFLDISDKKEMELKLEENRHLLNTLIEYIPIGIFAKNEETGKILSWNSKMEEISGKHRETVIGKTEEEALPFISKSSVIRNDLKASKRKQPATDCKRVIINNEKELWLNTTKLAVPSIKNQEEMILSIVEDITEKKALEAKLNQSEKLKAIGQLAGGVAHDFNNQLTAILGYASLIAEKVEDKEVLVSIETIICAAKYSADLTMKLLSFSRKGNQILSIIDMHQLINEVASILKHTFHKNIKLELALNAESHYIKGDQGQLNNAIINLALNARDALQYKGGCITISTENRTADEIDPQLLIIKVKDNGHGMTKKVKQQIFEPFFTTKDIGKGSGLGLSAVFGTVKAHQGNMEVESEPGKGSCFTLSFPVSAITNQNEKEKSEEEDKRKGNFKANILIVEDEEAIRKLYKTTLHNMGHQTTLFAYPDEALNYYKNYWEHIDLVILDIIMPGMNGSVLFSEMKKINEEIKAIIISGFVTDSEVENLYKNGISSFIQKPFSHHRLQEIINRELANKS